MSQCYAVPTTCIAIDRGSGKWNGRSALQSYAVQCESRENGPIVHNEIEKKMKNCPFVTIDVAY